MPRKYGRQAQKSVEEALHKQKLGKLKSGRSGKTVQSKAQAIAIGLSEARKKRAKVRAAPRRKRPSPRRETTFSGAPLH
jgi:hypothetical protein